VDGYLTANNVIIGTNGPVYFAFNPVLNATPMLNMNNKLTSNGIGGAVTAYFIVENAPVGTWNITFASYLADQTLDPSQSDISATHFVVTDTPTLTQDWVLCRRITGIQVTTEPNFNTNMITQIAAVTIVDKPGWDCVTGRGSRSWVVVLMVVLGIHAIILIIAAIVTCKVVSLREKIWDTD